MLYTVHFTTRQTVSKFDARGRLTGEYQTDIPQTISALPVSTARQYADCDNFRMEPYVPEERRGTRKSFKHAGYAERAKGMTQGEITLTTSGSKGRSRINDAAATGDLGAAISGAAQ